MASEPLESLHVPLEGPLHDFVRQQAAAAGYSDPAHYVGDLIRAARSNEAQRRLEAALIAGLESGPAVPMTDADWDELRRRAKQRGGVPRSAE